MKIPIRIPEKPCMNLVITSYSIHYTKLYEVCDEDIDSMATDEFMKLVGEISIWANGGHQSGQKKN